MTTIMDANGNRLYGEAALAEEQRRAKERIAKKTKQHQEQQEELFKADARNTYIHNGGTREEFDRRWPEIRKALIADMAKPGGGTGVSRPSNIFRVRL